MPFPIVHYEPEMTALDVNRAALAVERTNANGAPDADASSYEVLG